MRGDVSWARQLLVDFASMNLVTPHKPLTPSNPLGKALQTLIKQQLENYTI